MRALPFEVDFRGAYAFVAMDAEHLDDVLAIERMCHSNPWPREAFEHEIEGNPMSSPQVAVTTGEVREVAGYIIAWIVFEELHIQNLSVHPRHRRRGLGTQLVGRAIAEGRTRGTTFALLEVRRSNAVARELYASLGFRAAGERENYYSRPREDAVLLRLDLE